MGCRTRVMANIYDPSREIVNGRGNLSFTSINLPRIGIRSHGDINLFFEDLDRKIDLVINQLLERFEIQARKKVRNYPFLMGQGVWIDSDKLGPDDEVREVLKHGTLTIGFIGLAETPEVALTGKHHGESKESQNLGLEIVGYMRRRMDEASQKYGLNFSLIATPAEGLSGRFVRIDRGAVRRAARRHRPGVLYQLLPHSGLLPHLGAGENPAGGALSRADQRRTHHLYRDGRRSDHQPRRV